MTTAKIYTTTGNVTSRKVTSWVEVEAPRSMDRRAARELARANVSTVKGQAVEVITDGAAWRFSHSEISK